MTLLWKIVGSPAHLNRYTFLWVTMPTANDKSVFNTSLKWHDKWSGGDYHCTHPDQLHHVLHKAVHLHPLQLPRLVLTGEIQPINKASHWQRAVVKWLSKIHTMRVSTASQDHMRGPLTTSVSDWLIDWLIVWFVVSQIQPFCDHASLYWFVLYLLIIDSIFL